MSLEPARVVEDFVSQLVKKHPGLHVTCDEPGLPTGSTWIDIRAGATLVVVEFDPKRGFGFAKDEHDTTYGTPSARFIRDVDKAVAHLGEMMRDLVPSPARVG